MILCTSLQAYSRYSYVQAEAVLFVWMLRPLSVASTVRSRMYSTSQDTGAVAKGPLQPREVQLPVPWGHIAGKAWGQPSGKPVLALHGWLDNANSFDKLIPLLSSGLHVVALDWPGHGRSSHRPPGNNQYGCDYVADIKYAADALKWDKFMILAHSMGTGAASWFAAALPEQVEAMVLIEGIGFWSVPEERLPVSMGRALRSLSAEEESKNKTYASWDAVVDRVMEGHAQMFDKETSARLFDREAATTLALRGTQRLDDGRYQFTRDLRLKRQSLLKAPNGANHAFVQSIQCPVLLILAEKSYVSFSDVRSRLVGASNFDQVKVVTVPGGHHVHLCDPDVLCRLVDNFLDAKTVLPEYDVIEL